MKNFRGVAAVIISVFLIACTPEYRIIKVDPELARLGNRETVNIELNFVPKNANFNIMPGGANEIARLPTDAHASKVVMMYGQIAVQTKSKKIEFWQYHDNRLEHRGSVEFSSDISALLIDDDRLLVLADHTLYYVSPSHAINIAGQVNSPNIIEFASINGENLCFVDAQRQLVASNVIDNVIKEIGTIRLSDITVSNVSATPYGCIVTADRIIRSYSVEGQQLKLVDNIRLKSTIASIQYDNGKLHIANTTTGYTIIDVGASNSLRWLASYQKGGAIDDVAANNDSSVVVSKDGILSFIGTKQIDTPNLQGDLKIDNSVRSVAYKKPYVAVLTDRDLRIIDFANQTTPVVSSLGASWGGSRRSVVDGNFLYVADWFSGLHIYDIADRNNISHVSTFHTTGSAKGVLVENGVAYVGDDDQGLEIIDVRDPTRAKQIGHLPLPGLAYTMTKIGNRLYLAGHYGGFHIIDVSNIARPILLGSVDTPGKSWAVQVHNNLAYVADDKSGVLIFDIADPTQINLVGQFNPNGQAEDIVLDYPYAYVAFFDRGFYILDVTDPRDPRELSHLNLPGNTRGIVLDDKIAYVAGWQAGLQAVDIADRQQPKLIDSFDTIGSAWGVSITDKYAFVMDWWGGISVIGISNPRDLQLIQTYHGSTPLRDIDTYRNFIFAAAGDRGLQVFDGRNALNPIWAAAFEMNDHANSIAISDDFAYVGTNRGISIFNISEPYTPVLLKTISFSQPVKFISTAANLLCVASEKKLALFSLDLKEKPKNIGLIDTNITALTTESTGCVIAQQNKISKFTVAANGNYNEAELVDANAQNISVTNSLLIVKPTDKDQIDVYQLNGSNIKVDSVKVDFSIDSIFSSGTTLLAVERGRAVHRFEFRNSGLTPIETYPTRHLIEKGVLKNGNVFFAGEAALVTMELLPEYDVTVQNRTVQFSLPASMPLGSYHVTMSQSGQARIIFPNRFRVDIPAPKKQRFTLEDLKKKMQSGNFEGRAPTTNP